MKAPAYIKVALLLVAAAALAAASVPAAAADMNRMTMTITNAGIMTGNESPEGGLYVVTVKNETCAARGLVMKGPDRGVTRYLRFTKVLAPGESQSFRWYFPTSGDVRLRDLLACDHKKMTCVAADFGGFVKELRFG